mgnify:CR=1 FL=1
MEEGEIDEERVEIEEDLEAQRKQEKSFKQGHAGEHRRGDSLFSGTTLTFFFFLILVPTDCCHCVSCTHI